MDLVDGLDEDGSVSHRDPPGGLKRLGCRGHDKASAKKSDGVKRNTGHMVHDSNATFHEEPKKRAERSPKGMDVAMDLIHADTAVVSGEYRPSCCTYIMDNSVTFH